MLLVALSLEPGTVARHGELCPLLSSCGSSYRAYARCFRSAAAERRYEPAAGLEPDLDPRGDKGGSDGGQTLVCCLAGCPADRDPIVAGVAAYPRHRPSVRSAETAGSVAPGFPGDHGQVAAEEEHWNADELDPSADRDPGRDRHHGGGTEKPDGPRSRRPARPSFSGGGHAPNGTEPGAQRPRRCENWAGVSIGGLVPIRSVRSRSPETSTSTFAERASASK